MSDEDWQAGFAKSLAIFLNGETIPSMDVRGDPVTDDSFYLVFNGHHERLDFTLPDESVGASWVERINTATATVGESGREYRAGDVIEMAGRSVVVLERQVGASPGARR